MLKIDNITVQYGNNKPTIEDFSLEISSGEIVAIVGESGMGSSEADLRRICKGAKVLDGLSIKGSEASKSEEIVSKWAKQRASL